MAASQRYLPSNNPYGSGVIFDSSPYTQYQLAQKAKEDAKDEALDKYFKNIDSKINPAGMRTQEIPVLLQQQNADRKFYLDNKDKIKNPALDNGTAYNEYMGRNQAKMAFVEGSKRKADIYKQAVPIFADPTKRALMGDEAIAALESHDLPMNDPRHQEFDVTKLNYNPKPFDQQKYLTGLKPLVKEAAGETSFVPIPDTDAKSPQYLRKPVTKMIQNYDKMQIANLAENEYKQNPSYRALIKQIENNPTQYDKYNKIYKQNFGNDLDISHPEQIAVAHTLEMMPKGYTKEGKPELDNVAWESAKNKRNFGQSLTKISANKEAQNAANYNPQNHWVDIVNNGIKDPSKYLVKDKWVGGTEISLPDEVNDKLFDKVAGKVKKADKVILDDNGKQVHLIFFEGDEKNPTGSPKVNQKKTTTIPVSSTMIPLLEKQFGNSKKNLYTQPLSNKQKIAGF